MSNKYQLVVIGSGPGGYFAAIRAAQLGFRTAIVERAECGGVCLNWGCIPTKALLHCARVFEQTKQGGNYGVLASKVTFDFSKMVSHSRQVVTKLTKGLEVLFRKNKITLLRGSAEIQSDQKVQVTLKDGGKKIIETDNILIASGARQKGIPGVKFDGKRIITSKEALMLKKVPKSLAVIGAGAVGVELAYLYSALGSKVTLLEMMPGILPTEDQEVVDIVAKSFRKMGMVIQTGFNVTAIDKFNKGLQIKQSESSGENVLQADTVIVSVGVQGNIENIGLEALGVEVQGSFIKVDKTSYRTNVPNIYAIGDVIGPPWLANAASAEGILTVERIAGLKPEPIDYDFIPSCVYCRPEIFRIGYTEEQARAKGFHVKVGRFLLQANAKSVITGQESGFTKLIFDEKSEELLGAHVVGQEAAAMSGELVAAKSLQTTAEELASSIHVHPTLSEAVQEAAEAACGRAIHK